jgi:two-component system response regulator DesR
MMTGLELAANLRTSHPAVRTIILTTLARPGYLRPHLMQEHADIS